MERPRVGGGRTRGSQYEDASQDSGENENVTNERCHPEVQSAFPSSKFAIGYR